VLLHTVICIQRVMEYEVVIDTTGVTNTEEFYDVIEATLGLDHGEWGRNMDALADVLGGGMGSIPDGARVIVDWQGREDVLQNLGEEFASQLEEVFAEAALDAEVPVAEEAKE
jgi:RNAse (barnase) inhibitor barstar